MVFFVIALRLILPLFMVHFPLTGWVVSFIGDNIDLVLLEAAHSPYLKHYQQIDKLLDLFFLTVIASLVIRWKKGLIRSLALVMYFWRFIGVFVFIIIGAEQVLLFFPDVLPVFFPIVLLDTKFFHSRILSTNKKIAITAFILLLIKIVFEYVLHVYIPLQR